MAQRSLNSAIEEDLHCLTTSRVRKALDIVLTCADNPAWTLEFTQYATWTPPDVRKSFLDDFELLRRAWESYAVKADDAGLTFLVFLERAMGAYYLAILKHSDSAQKGLALPRGEAWEALARETEEE